MSNKSSSKTRRTYNTTNQSQQGDGNVYGKNNRVTIQRADALTLDRIANALARGVEDLSRQGEDQTRRALEAAEGMTGDTLDAAERINRDSLDAVNDGHRRALDFGGESLDLAGDALDENTATSRQALSALESVARQAQQASEQGTQSAMDFVSSYTERDQIGSEGEQLRTLQYVAAAVAVALVGIAWASKGGIRS